MLKLFSSKSIGLGGGTPVGTDKLGLRAAESLITVHVRAACVRLPLSYRAESRHQSEDHQTRTHPPTHRRRRRLNNVT